MATWQEKLNSYKTDTSAAQAEILRAKEVYETKKRLGDLAGAQAAHTWANQIRSVLGSAIDNTKFGSGVTLNQARENYLTANNNNTPEIINTGNGNNTSNNGNINNTNNNSIQEYTNYQNKLKELQKKSAIANLNNAYNSNLSKLNAEKAGIQPAYYNQKNNVNSQSMLNARNLAEYMAQRGLTNSGLSAQAEINRNMQLQGDIGNLNRQEMQANEDINRRITDATIAYNNDLANAEAGIESQALQNLMNEYQRQQSAQADQNRWQQQFDYNKTIDNRNFNYQTGRDAISDTRYDKEYKDKQAQINFENGLATKQLAESIKNNQWEQSKWQQQFSYQKIQDAIQNSLAQGRLSIEQASQALQKAKFATETDPNSIDNIYKKAQIDQLQGKGGLQYKDYISMGRDMLDKGNFDSVSQKYNKMYTPTDVYNWVKGLPLTASEKAKLANDLGLQK